MSQNQEHPARLRQWLSPVAHLSNNPVSKAGVILVTGSAIFWLFLLPVLVRGEAPNPYAGIFLFLVLPAVFFAGLLLIPLGIRLTRGRRAAGKDLPPPDLQDPRFRRLLAFLAITTFVNIVIASQLSFSAVHYMDSVGFCGQTCHTVMQPEFAAYQNSPHSRVECVACHIGPGASWFVKSKLSGVWQVFAVTFNTFPRPVPTPIEDLRPARETCETCHWPQKFGSDRLRIIHHFAEDKENTHTRSVLLMRIGGGRQGGPGIHGVHLGEDVVIRYRSDEKREKIPWVEYRRGDTVRVYKTADAGQSPAGQLREMDCMDCHNRPTHAFQMPDPAVNQAMAAGQIAASLPFAKQQAMAALKGNYTSHADAAEKIRAAFDWYYRKNFPDIYKQRREEVARSAEAVLGIYVRNVFPSMRVGWGTYPNHIGHNDFPGCFRCHDGEHTESGGRTIGQDCNSCHQLLAMEEPAPKILDDLGLANSGR